MFTSERKLVMAAAWGFVLLGGWALLLPLARAEEKKPQRHVRVEVRTDAVPIINAIPYLKQLFANATQEEQQELDKKCAADQTEKRAIDPKKCAADQIERLGIDFEACPAGIICPLGNIGECHIICLTHQGAACPVADKTAQVAQSCECCSELQCAACAGQNKLCSAERAKVCRAGQSCDHFTKCADFQVRECSECEEDADDCRDMVTELRVQNAILEAKMSAQEEIYKARVDILEHWAKLMAEKSKLEAELAFTRQLADERQEVCRQTLELKTQNHELEGLVRAANERKTADLDRQELVAENQKLKQRVAELERHISSRPGEVAR